MQKIKITLIKQTIYPNLIVQYESPISHACDIIFVSFTKASVKTDLW